MAGPVKWDLTGFDKLLKDTLTLQKNYGDFLESFMKEIGLRTLAQTRKLTPVITGHLRRQWQVSPVQYTENTVSVEIFNPVEYASFVEDGHRQERRFVPGRWEGDRFIYDPKSKEGMMLTEKWIPGQHMGSIAAAKIEMEVPLRYAKAFEAFMKRIGGST